MHLIDASPSAGSITLDPMQAHEIDAHPDGDRIWATIVALREALSVEGDEIAEEAMSASEKLKERVANLAGDLSDKIGDLEELVA